jgi:hypothetical protein
MDEPKDSAVRHIADAPRPMVSAKSSAKFGDMRGWKGTRPFEHLPRSRPWLVANPVANDDPCCFATHSGFRPIIKFQTDRLVVRLEEHSQRARLCKRDGGIHQVDKDADASRFVIDNASLRA